MILKNVQSTFTASFGVSRTGKTVSVSVVDTDGNSVLSGFTAGSVVELSDGSYGVAITFSTTMTGYIKFSNTTDGIEVYVPFYCIEDFRSDITVIKKIEMNRWKIESNQLTVYDDDGTTPLYVFNLKRLGSPNGESPDERVPA